MKLGKSNAKTTEGGKSGVLWEKLQRETAISTEVEKALYEEILIPAIVYNEKGIR